MHAKSFLDDVKVVDRYLLVILFLSEVIFYYRIERRKRLNQAYERAK